MAKAIKNNHVVGVLSTTPMHSRDTCCIRNGLVDTVFVMEPSMSRLDRFKFESDILPRFDIQSQVNIS